MHKYSPTLSHTIHQHFTTLLDHPQGDLNPTSTYTTDELSK